MNICQSISRLKQHVSMRQSKAKINESQIKSIPFAGVAFLQDFFPCTGVFHLGKINQSLYIWTLIPFVFVCFIFELGLPNWNASQKMFRKTRTILHQLVLNLGKRTATEKKVLSVKSHQKMDQILSWGIFVLVCLF